MEQNKFKQTYHPAYLQNQKEQINHQYYDSNCQYYNSNHHHFQNNEQQFGEDEQYFRQNQQQYQQNQQQFQPNQQYFQQNQQYLQQNEQQIEQHQQFSQQNEQYFQQNEQKFLQNEQIFQQNSQQFQKNQQYFKKNSQYQRQNQQQFHQNQQLFNNQYNNQQIIDDQVIQVLNDKEDSQDQQRIVRKRIIDTALRNQIQKQRRIQNEQRNREKLTILNKQTKLRRLKQQLDARQSLPQSKQLERFYAGYKQTIFELQHECVQVLSSEEQQLKQKKLVYIDKGRIRNNPVKCSRMAQKSPQYEQIYGFNPAARSYYEPLIQKHNYRFNMQWWEAGDQNKQLQEKEKEKPRYAKNRKYIPQDMKLVLKKRLKSLRRHKLIGGKYAPLSQFMNNGAFQKNGTVASKLVESSDSDDQVERYRKYDQARKNQLKAIKGKNQQQQAPNSLGIAMTSEIPVNEFQPKIDDKLKRALQRMKQHNWAQDRLFTKGMQQNKPIILQDL